MNTRIPLAGLVFPAFVMAGSDGSDIPALNGAANGPVPAAGVFQKRKPRCTPYTQGSILTLPKASPLTVASDSMPM